MFSLHVVTPVQIPDPTYGGPQEPPGMILKQKAKSEPWAQLSIAPPSLQKSFFVWVC